MKLILSGERPRNPLHGITQAQEPVIFWAMVSVNVLISAGVFYVTFGFRKLDA